MATDSMSPHLCSPFCFLVLLSYYSKFITAGSKLPSPMDFVYGCIKSLASHEHMHHDSIHKHHWMAYIHLFMLPLCTLLTMCLLM